MVTTVDAYKESIDGSYKWMFLENVDLVEIEKRHDYLKMCKKNRMILFFLCCSVLGTSVAVPVEDIKNIKGKEVKFEGNKSSVALKEQLVKFHPISQKQYDSILKLSGGQPIISEARLINSGIRQFGDFRSISSAIESGVQYVLNVTGLNALNEKPTQTKVEGYPLCVIKISDWQSIQNPENNNGDNLRKLERANENTNEFFYSNREEGNNSDQPAVNCVVVVKRSEDEEETANMRNSWLNDLRYASTLNPYARYGYYPPFFNQPLPSPSLSPYYYNYLYNQYPEREKNEENIYRQKLTKTASTENEGKSVNDSDDFYYRQLMLALNNYYLQQSYRGYQQAPITSNYQSYQANIYRPRRPMLNPTYTFDTQVLPTPVQRYPSRYHHNTHHHDSSEEENDYSNEQFSNYE